MSPHILKRQVCSVLAFLAIVISSSLVLASDTNVDKGDKVTLEFIASFHDGKVFDKAGPGDPPFTFVAGEGQILAALDKAVLGMKLGEKKKVTLSPKDAFGVHDPRLMEWIPRDKLPPKPEPKAGMKLQVRGPNGMAHATIKEVTPDKVKLDMNHPLAGKTLVFDIKVVKIG